MARIAGMAQLLLQGVVVCLGYAVAHHPNVAQLHGARFCIETNAVELDLPDSDDAGFLDVSIPAIARAGGASLHAALTEAGIDVRRSDTCGGDTDRIFVDIEGRFLDPVTYRGFPDMTYSVTIALRLEPAVGSERAFSSARNELYSETIAGRPIDEHLVREVRAGAVRLAGAWWEANPPRARTSWLPPMLGVPIAVGVAVVVGRLLNAHRKPQRVS